MNFVSANFQRSELSGLDVGGTKPFAESSALCCMPLNLNEFNVYSHLYSSKSTKLKIKFTDKLGWVRLS